MYMYNCVWHVHWRVVTLCATRFFVFSFDQATESDVIMFMRVFQKVYTAYYPNKKSVFCWHTRPNDENKVGYHAALGTRFVVLNNVETYGLWVASSWQKTDYQISEVSSQVSLLHSIEYMFDKCCFCYMYNFIGESGRIVDYFFICTFVWVCAVHATHNFTCARSRSFFDSHAGKHKFARH